MIDTPLLFIISAAFTFTRVGNILCALPSSLVSSFPIPRELFFFAQSVLCGWMCGNCETRKFHLSPIFQMEVLLCRGKREMNSFGILAINQSSCFFHSPLTEPETFSIPPKQTLLLETHANSAGNDLINLIVVNFTWWVCCLILVAQCLLYSVICTRQLKRHTKECSKLLCACCQHY
jgi:hypothetical protein